MKTPFQPVEITRGLFHRANLPNYMADRPESVMPPLQLGVRWMAAPYLSLGAFAGYSSSRSREKILFDSIRGRWDNSTCFLGLENGFHYTKVDDWDFYGGFTLLYQYTRVSTDNPEFEKAIEHAGIQHSSGKMSMTAFVGSRFALLGHSSIFMELGYGISLLKVGVGYKL